jgi:hypothetical protein
VWNLVSSIKARIQGKGVREQDDEKDICVEEDGRNRRLEEIA